MAPVLKTGEAKASVGSNPTLSVSKKPDTAGGYKLKPRQRYPLRRLYQIGRSGQFGCIRAQKQAPLGHLPAVHQTQRERRIRLSVEGIKHGLWVGPSRPTEQVVKS